MEQANNGQLGKEGSVKRPNKMSIDFLASVREISPMRHAAEKGPSCPLILTIQPLEKAPLLSVSPLWAPETADDWDDLDTINSSSASSGAYAGADGTKARRSPRPSYSEDMEFFRSVSTPESLTLDWLLTCFVVSNA